MNCRIRDVALLLLVLAFAAGLASAQPGLSISQISSSGQVTQSNFDPSVIGPDARAPRAGKYWDGLASTDFYNFTTSTTAPPNPQIAAGPDDIVTIVNRTIARYPNPNAVGNALVTTPYNYPPTSKAFLDVWMGVTQASSAPSALATACPSVPRSNTTCIIDNASIRYDQMQGRFVVLFTATDVQAHLSNWVLITSRYATFACPSTVTAANCPNTSDMFTNVVVPQVGGTSTGGTNAYWVLYLIPINVTLPAAANTSSNAVLSTPACTGPNNAGIATSPSTGGPVAAGACTNYFPTGARFGLDNDNIILTAPVLDATQQVVTGTAITNFGPFAGTRVAAVPKLNVFNGTTTAGQVNLSDDNATGTLTGVPSNAAIVAGTTLPTVTGCCNTAAPAPQNPNIPAIFWEPDNVRGRALASFDAQVAPINAVGTVGSIGGVIAPFDYLVGRFATDTFGGFSLGTGQAVGQATTVFIQPIIFTCPTSALFSGPAGVPYCGTSTLAGQTQIAEVPVLGAISTQSAGFVVPNGTAASGSLALSAAGCVAATPTAVCQQPMQLHTLATTSDPATVGQGKNDLAVNQAQDGTALPRIFVGDQRPQQVMFREGLLYAASTIRLWEANSGVAGSNFAFGTATVMYNVLKAPGPTCSIAQIPPFVAGVLDPCLNGSVGGATGNPYTPNGSRFAQANEAIETYWYNGTNVPDPTGNSTGYGFYAPAFDSPANVINGSSLPNSSGISPVNLFPWLEKLFVGNTVGGPATINNTFATHFPSVWDVRPGDDGFDTNLSYLDPVLGTVIAADTRLCAPAFTVQVTENGTRVLSNLSPTVPNSGAGPSAPLAVGQLVSGPGIPAATTISALCAAACTATATLPAAPANSIIISAAATLGSATNPTRVGITVTPPPPPAGTTGGACPMVPFGYRGGASTDPTDGSLWIYEPFAKFRLSGLIGPGNWGTSVANYQLDFPAQDPYGNDNAFFGDVPTTYPFFTWIQIAKNAGIWTNGFAATACTVNQPNPPVVPPPVGTSSGGTGAGASQTCTNFQPTDQVTRAEMAMWVVRSQMDDAMVINFLNATGGLPQTSGLGATSFADNPLIPQVAGCPIATNPPQGAGTQFCSAQTIANYIETMYRRGYTKGCSTTNDGRRNYCPADFVTRGQMSIFLVRAKMANVYPTSLSGVPVTTAPGPAGTGIGDAFGFFTPAQAYFTDCTPTGCGTSAGAGANGPYLFVQKMRELRITNGTTGSTFSPDAILTREQIATFVVRAFLL